MITLCVLDDLDDPRHVLLCAALKDGMLQHEPHRLAHPHRDAEFFALLDGEIDVLHEYLDGCTKVERAWQHGIGENVHGRKILVPGVEQLARHWLAHVAGAETADAHRVTPVEGSREHRQ